MAVCVSWVSLNGLDWPWAPLSGCLTIPFCLQTKEQILIRASSYGQPGGKPWFTVTQKAAEASSFYEGDVGCLPPLLSHRKGPFSGWLATWHVHPPGHQMFKDFSVDRAAHGRLAWWNLLLESTAPCMFLVMVDLMKFPGSHTMLLHKVVEALWFASCIRLSQHSLDEPLCWSKVYQHLMEKVNLKK